MFAATPGAALIPIAPPGHDAAGDRAARKVKAHLQRLVPYRFLQCFLFAQALRLVGVDALPPLALVLGEKNVRYEVDNILNP